MNPEDNPFFEKPKKPKSAVVDIIQSVVIALSLSIFLYLFIITPNQVDGPSMQPNFYTGELLFTSKLHKWFNGTGVGDALHLEYDRGDVIVFQKPGNDDFVKRIIGLPGESIRIEDGVYYINGEALSEEYNLNNEEKRAGTFLIDGGPSKTVPDNEYFVSGDNRDVSYDSRSIGFIKDEWIKGKVIFRFWHIDKIGIIEAGKSKFE